MEAESLTDDVTGAVRGTKRLLDSESGRATSRSHMEHEYPRAPPGWRAGGPASRWSHQGCSRELFKASSGAQPQLHSLVLQGTQDWVSRGVSLVPPRRRRSCTCSAPGKGSWLPLHPVAHTTILHPAHGWHVCVTPLSQFLVGAQERLPFINPPAPFKSLGVHGTSLFPSHST